MSNAYTTQTRGIPTYDYTCRTCSQIMELSVICTVDLIILLSCSHDPTIKTCRMLPNNVYSWDPVLNQNYQNIGLWL